MFETYPLSWRLWVIAGLVSLTAGCGERGPKVFEVAGKVTYKGTDISSGSVTFAPKGGGDLIVVAIENGSYQLTAPVAEYEVGVTATANIASGKEGFEQKVARPTLPSKFSHPSRSGVVVTVEEKDLNTIDLELN